LVLPLVSRGSLRRGLLRSRFLKRWTANKSAAFYRRIDSLPLRKERFFCLANRGKRRNTLLMRLWRFRRPCIMKIAMSTKRRVPAFFLLGAVISVFLPAYGLSVPVIPTEQSAPCHQHGHRPSSPEPVDHQCCRVGHHAAILPAFSKPQPALESSSIAFGVKEPSITSPHGVSRLLVSSEGTPSNPPLRV